MPKTYRIENVQRPSEPYELYCDNVPVTAGSWWECYAHLLLTAADADTFQQPDSLPPWNVGRDCRNDPTAMAYAQKTADRKKGESR